MNNEKLTEAVEERQPHWLDDWDGLHTIDDGQPSSYEHEAVAAHDPNGTYWTPQGTASLTCSCGDWSVGGPVGDEEPTRWMDAWQTHVYTAQGGAR